jgi:hypothetical protein
LPTAAAFAHRRSTAAGPFDAIIDIKRRRMTEKVAVSYLFFRRFFAPVFFAAFAFLFFAMLPS